jgi:hypothetical protein
MTLYMLVLVSVPLNENYGARLAMQQRLRLVILARAGTLMIRIERLYEVRRRGVRML